VLKSCAHLSRQDRRHARHLSAAVPNHGACSLADCYAQRVRHLNANAIATGGTYLANSYWPGRARPPARNTSGTATSHAISTFLRRTPNRNAFARRSMSFTTVVVSLSKSGVAHPQRSNPPLRSSSGPPMSLFQLWSAERRRVHGHPLFERPWRLGRDFLDRRIDR
jgi:hypothetical protein